MPTETTPKTTPKKTTDGAAIDALQKAVSDLDEARRRAGGELRTQLDAITERLTGVVSELRERAGEQTKEIEASLERASDHLRLELGLRAVRAQDSPEALREIAAEVRKRKAELTA